MIRVPAWSSHCATDGGSALEKDERVNDRVRADLDVGPM